MFKFIVEQNAREIKYFEIIAIDEEDAFEEYIKGNYKLIRSKTIDSEGFNFINKTEIEQEQ